MNVICPQCNATYHFPESRIPDRRASFQCKRCGKRVLVEARAAGGVQAPKADLPHRPAEPSRIPATLHQGIADELPEVTALSARNYALDQLLLPDKKGRYKTRLNKLKLKLIGAVRAPLDHLLDQNEQVVRIAGGTAYYPAEIFLGNGWLTLLYNRYVIVGTTKRIVAINTNTRMNKPAHYFFQFPYDTIKKVSRGLFGTSIVLTRKKSKRRIFTGIKRSLAAELKNFIGSQIDPSLSLDPKALPPENLCPACYAPLPGSLSSCPKCRALFKNPRKAALRSLLMPGWGDVYLGHRFLGIFEMLGSLCLWAFFLISFFSNDPANFVIGIVLLAFYCGMDGLLTLHMANKGYCLQKKQNRSTAPARLSTSRA